MIPHENHVSLNERSPQPRKVSHLVSQLITLGFFTSSFFLVFCFILHIFVQSNPFFPWSNLFIFLITLISCLFRPLLSIGILVFIIPFTSNISEQIKALFHLEIFSLQLLSIDASIGFLSGLLILHIFTRKWKFSPENLPNKTRLLAFLLFSFQVLIVITVAIAISRNLYQAASPYSLKGFFYNLTNIRYTSWHDDYFPLRDLFIFTNVITLSLSLLTLIRTRLQLIWSVLVPLLTATVIILNYALLSRLMNIGYNNGMSAESGVSSFFPDVHAYGGYGVMAFVGGLYYLNSSKTRLKIAAGTFCLLALVGVVVSSSRFSIVTLLIALLIYVFLLIFKNYKKHLLTLVFITIITATAAGALSYWGTRGLFDSLSQASKAQSFETLSFALSDRPEIFRATLLMYSHYPILGLGKGSFNRDNSILEFSKSPFFASYPGENAHNYFLQILAETGLIGLSLFCAIFLYQAFVLRNSSNQILTILIMGLFSGNFYGHSLLIPNLLVLLFILLGASNTEVQDEHLASAHILPVRFPKAWRYFLIAAVTVLIIGAISEVKASYGKMPFQQRFLCNDKAYYGDKQTGGFFEQTYQVTGNALKLKYSVAHPDVSKHPLYVAFNLDRERQNIASYERLIKTPGDYLEKFDISQLAVGSNIILRIKPSRCLTPINLGINFDNRRLGIALLDVSQDKRVAQGR
jgi:O-antigen ligase